MATVFVEIPFHLRTLANVDGKPLSFEVVPPVTLRTVLDAVEIRYPMLRGTIRDHQTKKHRPFLRFFACHADLTHLSPDEPLPVEVAAGRQPLLIIGAISGG